MFSRFKRRASIEPNIKSPDQQVEHFEETEEDKTYNLHVVDQQGAETLLPLSDNYTMTDLHQNLAAISMSPDIPCSNVKGVPTTNSEKVTEEDLDLLYQIYSQNESAYPPANVLGWLATPGEYNELLRKTFLGFFDFSGKSPLGGLRVLSFRLIIRGESQEIDRIIECFAQRWCICNLNHGLKHVDVVHALVYALLLLNTDLHSTNIPTSQKMTKEQFIQNTLDTVLAEDKWTVSNGIESPQETFMNESWCLHGVEPAPVTQNNWTSLISLMLSVIIALSSKLTIIRICMIPFTQLR
jgi:hypothetical protein